MFIGTCVASCFCIMQQCIVCQLQRQPQQKKKKSETRYWQPSKAE